MKLPTTLQLILLLAPFIGAISINGPSHSKRDPGLFSDFGSDAISGAESFAKVFEKGADAFLKAGQNPGSAGSHNETLNAKHARGLSDCEEASTCGVESFTKNSKTGVEALVKAGQYLANAGSNNETLSSAKQARGLSEFGTEAVSAAESFARNFQAGIEALTKAGQNLANAGLNEETTSELRKWFGEGVKLLSSVVPKTTTSTKRDDKILADESLATAAKENSKQTFPPFYETKREDLGHYIAGLEDEHAEQLETREDRERFYSFVMDDRIRKPRGIEDHNAHVDQDINSCPCAPVLQ